MNEQIKFSFDKETMKKILRGALIAGGGAVLTYLAQNLSEMNFGAYTPIVVALMSILINAAKEYIKGEEE